MMWTDLIVIPFVLLLCGAFCWCVCAASRDEETPPDTDRDKRWDE